MPGVIEVDHSAPISQVIANILLLAEVSLGDEWASQIIYLPLK